MALQSFKSAIQFVLYSCLIHVILITIFLFEMVNRIEFFFRFHIPLDFYL